MSNPYLDLLFSVAVQKNKIVVPTDFHGQVIAIEDMLKNDSSGLVNTLMDFSIESANVKYEILTKNTKLNEILKTWLKNINQDFLGQIPKGLEELVKEYGRERWKGASFPILKIVGTTEIGGLVLPSKMYFVNGGAVHAEEKKGAGNSILKWLYFLGKKKTTESTLSKGVIITKPYSRWYEKYPTPYLINRGVYHNWKLLQTLKGKQGEALEQIIPMLNLITKGDVQLAKDDKQTYDQPELEQIKTDIQDLLEEVKKSLKVKSPTRVVPFDEKWEQIIPDLSKLFNIDISASIERNILAGLGFIDVEEAVTSSRRESVLNPKAFIGEVKSGVDDFAKIIEHLIDIIIDLNEDSTKYNEALRTANVTHSAVEPFMTDRFRQEFRLLWKHGQVSNQTYAEVVGGVDFATEKMRRENEATEGTEVLMYPHLTQNTEQNQSPEEVLRLKKLLDVEPEEETDNKTQTDDKDVDKTGAPVTRDKVGEPEEFQFSKELEIAPYKNIKALPPRVKDNMSPDLQRVFVRVFNNALNLYKDETRAFRVAWSIIRTIGRKDKNGLWIRKKKRANGKLVKLKLTRAMVEKVLDKEEEEAVDTVIKEKTEKLKIENLTLRNLLLKALVKDKQTK